jgi:hypothetical protein
MELRTDFVSACDCSHRPVRKMPLEKAPSPFTRQVPRKVRPCERVQEKSPVKLRRLLPNSLEIGYPLLVCSHQG